MVIEAQAPAAPPRPGPSPRRSARDALAAAYRWIGTRNQGVVLLLSLVTGFAVSAVLIVATTADIRIALGGLFRYPGNALAVTGEGLWSFYTGLFRGAIVDPEMLGRALADPSTAAWRRALTPLGNTITAAVPLAIVGVGLAIAYRSAAFNMGAHAQMVGGGIGASWVAFGVSGLPWLLHVLLAIVAAVVGGALCGLLPGVLKAVTGASEVIVTIMFNYVMANVLVFLLSSTFFRAEGNGVANPVGRVTPPSAGLTDLVPFLPVNTGAIVALLVVIAGAVLLNRSRLGFEMQIAGASPRAADVAGIRRKVVVVWAFVISGAVCGIAGAVQVLGVSQQLQVEFGHTIGTLGILVAFVGNTRPVGVAGAALLYGALQAGGLTAQLDSGVSYQLTNVMQSLIVMFVTAPALIAAIYRLRERQGASR